MEELFPCYSQRSGFCDVRLGTVCLGAEGAHNKDTIAVDDIAGRGDEVWEQAISKLKKHFTFGHWEVGKGEIL